MKDEEKSHRQLLDELQALRGRPSNSGAEEPDSDLRDSLSRRATKFHVSDDQGDWWDGDAFGTTQSIDLGNLFGRDVSDTGSFELWRQIWTTTFGKILQALPIPALLIDKFQHVIVVNQACGKIGPEYESILGKPFAGLVSNPTAADRARAFVDEVYSTRKPRIAETLLKIGQRSIWARLTLRPVRVMDQRFILLLLEDLTDEKKQLALNRKLREELERRVQGRTRELSQANKRLRKEIAEREKIERALGMEELRFRTFIEHAPFGMAMIGGDGAWKYINPKFTELFGYTFPDVPSGKVWFRKAYPDPAYRKEVISAWIEDMNRVGAGEARPRTLAVTCSDGSEKIIHFRSVQLGTGEHLLTCEDITDRKRSEQELQRHKDTLEALLNATTDLAVLLDRNGNVLALNQEVAARFGTMTDKLLGRCIFDFSSPDVASRLIARFETVVRTGKPSREAEIGRDAEIYDLNAYPVPGPDGAIEAVAIFARDITEGMRAEEELRKSEKKYRNILETITEGYHEVDLAGNLTLVNDSLCEIIGYSREELLGMNYRQLMNEYSAKKVYEAYNQVYRTGEVNPGCEYQLIRKDKATKDVSVSISLIRDSEGNPAGFRGIFRDITEQKRLEEQLRQAVKMEAIGKLAGGVAHDFNNILTAVMGYTSILAQQLPKDASAQDKLSQIAHAAEKAADLTRQLLAFSRKQVLDVKVVNLNEVISDLEKMLTRLIGEDIELVTVFHESLGRVQVDPVQIQQIVMNLAVNARDALPAGGKLTLETANAFLDDEYARRHAGIEPGPYVMLSVTDNGTGMDPATCSRIFDPFFTTKERGVGTGLGLSTVYGIVKQHSGHISVYSEPARGTCFKIYLPLVESAPEQLHKAPLTKPQPRGSETILIVEDEPTLRELACEVLQLLGYRTLAASDWREAFQEADQWEGTIHLLLTDVVLPGMDGRSLFNGLSPKRPEMKVLYMSGYTDNAIVYHGVLDRGVHFLAKPFTLDALGTKVREVLDEPCPG